MNVIVMSILCLLLGMGAMMGLYAAPVGLEAGKRLVLQVKAMPIWKNNRFVRMFQKYALQKKDSELLTIIIQLQNLIVSQAEQPHSADSMIASIMRFSKLTRPAFGKTLTLLRLGRSDEVYQQFAGDFGTRLGEQFAGVLAKMDTLPPVEFLEQLDAFLEQAEEVKKTEEQKRQQLISTVVFAFASIQVLLVIMNFILLVVQNTLQTITV